MLQFQPPGFGQKVIHASLKSTDISLNLSVIEAGQGLQSLLGMETMVYYTQTTAPWLTCETEDLPPLIFLHSFGGGSSAYEWSKVYPAFAATHRVLAPDLIGWGESAHPVHDYQVSDYLTSIASFIRQTCRPPVTVVASSLTAALTIRLAIQQPDLFQALFLVCPSGFNDFGQGSGRRLPLQVINTPLLDNLIYALGAENELAVRNFLHNFLFAKADRVSQEIVQAYLTSAQQPNAKFAALAFLRGDLYFDLSLYIQELVIPTVILWGEEAQFTSVKLGRRLAKLNTNAIRDFHVIPDAGVLPHLEMPEMVIGLLQRYLHI